MPDLDRPVPDHGVVEGFPSLFACAKEDGFIHVGILPRRGVEDDGVRDRLDDNFVVFMAKVSVIYEGPFRETRVGGVKHDKVNSNKAIGNDQTD